jgi:hypothetical protein
MTFLEIEKFSADQQSGRGKPPAIPMPAGKASEQIGLAIARAREHFSHIGTGVASVHNRALAENLFDALVGFKQKTARLASGHFTKPERDKLFRQLDSLFDIESWESTDTIASEASFVTLLRMVLFLGGRRPALGLTSTGNFIASWTEGSDRLTIECKPHDHVRFVLVEGVAEQRETFASETNSTRLPKVFAPYEAPNRWFTNAINKAAA